MGVIMIKSHYDEHLGNYFTWIYGDHESIKENENFFKDHKIEPKSTKVAIDLGSGVGYQSIPLANLGFKVTSVDFSKKQLVNLRENSKNLNIEILEEDILHFDTYADKNPELIVCMGDTLTHLKNKKVVHDLVKNCFNELAAGGKLIISFRDLTFELDGIDRFIPIKSNHDKIFTCFLEYEHDRVHIYDIIHEKENGEWDQKISSYTKIKISDEEIKNIVESAGFKIDFFEEDHDIIYIIAVKK
jgi:2-polyprenyl-3-methyl-5-hydroxy-6-metoxy-1,4-benzoquinol methylase